MSRDHLPQRPGARFQPDAPRYAEQPVSAGPFMRALLVGALALSVGLLIAAVSARQVSQRGNALPLMEASIQALADPEPLVAGQLDSLRARARDNPEEGVQVTGFPLDVRLSPDEARTLDAPAIADLLVRRGAVIIYADGMGALDQTGSQDDGVFSAQGIVRRIGDRLTTGAHESANTLSLVFLVTTGALAVVVALVYREDRRLRAVGAGVLLGGFAGLMVSLGLDFIAERAGSNDPYVSDVRAIVRDVIAVPRRNFLIVSFLGFGLTVASIALRFLPWGSEGDTIGDGEGV